MKKSVVVILILLFLSSFGFAKTQKEEYKNDYLYSAEYFDYLIECAESDRERMLEEEKEKKKNNQKKEQDELISPEEYLITDDFSPFHLRIEENIKTIPYRDTFKKVDSKTIIPISDKFSFIQDTSKTRNKYNSNDYKILAGAEFQPWKFLGFSSGLETNYRGLDQNPTSRKLYFTPGIYFGDKVFLKFHNKMNILNYSSDHDIGISISPFKSKIMDFGIYSGLTRKKDGSITESINFSTNFYF